MAFSSSRFETSSPLLLLPPEIRRDIHDALLVLDHPIVISSRRHRSPADRSGSESPFGTGYSMLGLSHACRQLYEESIMTYYAKNVFEFHYPLLLCMFIYAVGLINSNAIMDLRIVYGGGIEPYSRYAQGLQGIVTIEFCGPVDEPSRCEETRKFCAELPKLETVIIRNSKVIETELNGIIKERRSGRSYPSFFVERIPESLPF